MDIINPCHQAVEISNANYMYFFVHLTLTLITCMQLRGKF